MIDTIMFIYEDPPQVLLLAQDATFYRLDIRCGFQERFGP